MHYGVPGYRAACGMLHPRRVTNHQPMVTCGRCRGTLKFASAWYAPRPPAPEPETTLVHYTLGVLPEPVQRLRRHVLPGIGLPVDTLIHDAVNSIIAADRRMRG
jgi:hypothetical protein